MSKRIISFGLWGENPIYLQGALANVTAAKEHYPEWKCKFYINKDVSVLSELRELDCEIIETDDELDWRQLAASDPIAEYIIFRDVDGRLSANEARLVNEWIASGENGHVIYPPRFKMFLRNCNRPILFGGLWGVKGGVLPDAANQLRKWHDPHKMFAKSHDFQFADKYITPVIGSLKIDRTDDAYIGTTILPPGYKRPKKNMRMVCQTRAHCKNCRTRVETRRFFLREFNITGPDDFDCPFGITLENLPTQEEIDKRKAIRKKRKMISLNKQLNDRALREEYAKCVGRYPDVVDFKIFLERITTCYRCRHALLHGNNPYCQVCKCGTTEAPKNILSLAAQPENLPRFGCKHKRRGQWKERKHLGWRR